METTVPLPFIPSVDLGDGASESAEGLSRNQLAYLGIIYFAASNENVDTVLGFLQGHTTIEAYVDVTAVLSTDDIISILDAGARKVFVKLGQFKALESYKDRLIPSVSATDSSSAYANGVLWTVGEDVLASKTALEGFASQKISPIYVTSSTSKIDASITLAKEYSAVPIVPSTNLTVEKAEGKLSVADIIGSSWSSDRADKLMPTVVTDERGIALGLVYSSPESLAESLKTGTGVYQSRKRGLWYKGATSGDTQELVRISLDCDQDCLKFVVRQQGRGRNSHFDLQSHMLRLSQVSVISLNRHALESFADYPSLRRLLFRGRLLLQKDHILLVSSMTRNYCEPKSWKKLKNYAMPRPGTKSHLKLRILFTLPSPRQSVLESVLQTSKGI